MQVLSAREMSEADRRSVDAGIAMSELMEAAGLAVAAFCEQHYPATNIVVLCGKGNNGGDGMVAAQKLASDRSRVRLVLLGSSSELRGEAADAWRQAKRTQRFEVRDAAELHELLDGADLIIDAVVGTGFKPPLRGLPAAAKEFVAQHGAAVIAVDLPSGCDADSTEETQDAFRADAVVTFTAPKRAHVFGALTTDVFGPVVVAEIGTPADAVQSGTAEVWAGAAKEIASKPRPINSNKGKFGYVLIVGGAFGKAGAPSMAGLAALRSGAGLVTAAVPREILSSVAAVAPELMMTPLSVSPEDAQPESLAKLLKGISVVGIGPGLGTEPATIEFVRNFVTAVELPMVIDADALNAVAADTSLLRAATEASKANGSPRTIVLTPHPGEMARLIGSSVKDVEADRINIARKFAAEHGVTLVLKGWRTLIAHPDGRIAVNTTGNPAMAKGGSGDILTGIMSAMLAQYKDDVPRAVEAAVFLHGLAGDFACLEQDQHTVLATDTVDHLWEAFQAPLVDSSGLTWICGTARAAKIDSSRRRFHER